MWPSQEKFGEPPNIRLMNVWNIGLYKFKCAQTDKIGALSKKHSYCDRKVKTGKDVRALELLGIKYKFCPGFQGYEVCSVYYLE